MGGWSTGGHDGDNNNLQNADRGEAVEQIAQRAGLQREFSSVEQFIGAGLLRRVHAMCAGGSRRQNCGSLPCWPDGGAGNVSQHVFARHNLDAAAP